MFDTKTKLLTTNGTAILLCLVVCTLSAVALSATVTVTVQTDRTQYRVGDTVNWIMYVWSSVADNRGISLLSMNLDDNTADTVELPLLQGMDFQDTAYGTADGFMKFSDGAISPVPPDLVDMTVMQLPGSHVLDVGNDGQTTHVFAKGGYTVNIIGDHILTGSFNAANYWADSTPTAMDFEIKNTIPTLFTVIPAVLNADINKDGFVDYLDFAIISENWDGTDCDQSQNCNGADINRDGLVDVADLLILVEQWMTNPNLAFNADINRDDFVDYIDFGIVSVNWDRFDCGQDNDCDGADINRDGIVNMGDLLILVEQWMSNPNLAFNADINRDFNIDYIDFDIVSTNWDRFNCAQYADCDGADINLDGFVNMGDLMVMVDQWL